MDVNQIASKDDILRLENALNELTQRVNILLSKQESPSRYLTGKQVMQLLQIKEWALRKKRLDGSIIWKSFGKHRRYPIDQFELKPKNKS